MNGYTTDTNHTRRLAAAMRPLIEEIEKRCRLREELEFEKCRSRPDIASRIGQQVAKMPVYDWRTIYHPEYRLD